MAGKGPTLADGAAHDCIADKCADRHHIASPVHMKWLDVTRHERTGRLVDNVDRKDVTAVALLALTQKDMDNLDAIAAADGRVRNFAVLIRRLVSREAKAVA